MIVRTTHHLKSIRVTEEIEIVLSSRPAEKMDAAQIQTFRRAHWAIENPIHYVRDVSFNEDRSTACTAHLPRNLATLRNVVIGLCALDSLRQGKRKRTSYLPTFRAAASNDHQVAVDLLTRPLLQGS